MNEQVNLDTHNFELRLDHSYLTPPIALIRLECNFCKYTISSFQNVEEINLKIKYSDVESFNLIYYNQEIYSCNEFIVKNIIE